MSGNTREALLAEASRIIHTQPFTKEAKAKAESLMKLAESMTPELNQLRKMKVLQGMEEIARFNPEYALKHRDELEHLSSTGHRFDTLLRHGPEAIDPAYRAQSVATGTGGGYLAPRQMTDVLFQKMAWFDPLFDSSNVHFIMSDNGDPLDVPVGDSTASATKYAENAQQTPSDVPAFAQVSLNVADTYRSPIQKVSMELTDDSNYPLEDVLTSIFAQGLARAVGVDLYASLASDATQGVVQGTGHASDITVDGLFDLAGSLDPVYHGAKTVFLMRYATALLVSKLKDTQGLPIFNINPDSNGERWLLGHKVLISPSAAAVGANSKPIILADLSRFVVRGVRQATIKTYRELYATEGALAFQSFARCNGKLAVTAAAKYLQNSAS